MSERKLRIGITCYPTIGGSGVVATLLGKELAQRGHEIHFISYDRPFRLPPDGTDNIYFHPVAINSYGLFKYPDYTLPLSVKMAEVSRTHRLDIMHVHYAVPHATAALLARCMLAPEDQPKLVTTLHGTDTTLLGTDPGYGPAIHHALTYSDAVTTVSAFLKDESRRVLGFDGPIDVIYNFFEPDVPAKTREEVRAELGVKNNETLLVHSSNLRPVKRFDLLLEAVSQIQIEQPFKLLVLAGAKFEPFESEVRRLGLTDKLIVRENVFEIEDYLQAADISLVSSETESFCLSILEAMYFGCPSVATSVGGIPELVQNNETGLLVPFGKTEKMTQAIERLIADLPLRQKMGQAGKTISRQKFSAQTIIPQYEALYKKQIANERPELCQPKNKA